MSLVTIFIIKSTLSDIYMDISALFWLLFAWYVFFHLFSFNLPAPLNLKCISGRQCVVSSLLFLRILAYWVKCLVTHIQLPYKVRFGLPRWLSGKESTCQCRRLRRCKFDPWVGKIPWRRNWQSTLVFLLGKFHGQRSLAGYSLWGHKELDTTKHADTLLHSLLHEKILMLPNLPMLEKAMETHSSTLVWKIPWTEEPSRLQSMRLLTVG